MSVGTLTIDHGAIDANWRALDAMTRCETGAVVKANAYGLDAESVAQTLRRSGVQSFFVAVAEEGPIVRESVGSLSNIFVFSGHMEGDEDLLREYQLVPLLNSREQIERHFSVLPGRSFGIQLDTGMNRLGLEPSDWVAVREDVLLKQPVLIMSHLACADDPSDLTNARQLRVFRAMTDGIDVPRSLAATGGILLGEAYHFDLTRPGIGLFGGSPFDAAEPVVKLTADVVQVRDVQVGETAGYGNVWIASRRSKIATLSVGYADGLMRALSPGAVVYDHDTACAVVGRISMDSITVDVTNLAHIPETLCIIGSHQTIDDLAGSAGTISYEILTSLGMRYRRERVNWHN